MHKKKIGIAYMGGGAMGAAEVGFRKALKEVCPNMKIHAVSGISAGAVNACLEVMDDVGKMQEFWINLTCTDNRPLITEFFDFVDVMLHSGLNFIICGSKPINAPVYKQAVSVPEKITKTFQKVINKLRSVNPLINIEEIWLKQILSYYGLYSPPMYSAVKLMDINPDIFTKLGRSESLFDIKPMMDRLDNYVDYDILKKSKTKLFIGTSRLEVKNKALEIKQVTIGNDKISKEWVQCSGTILAGSKIMKKNGSHYIDGGYTANPLLTPLILSGCDVILVAGLSHPEHLNLDDLSMADAVMISMALQIHHVVDDSLKITNLINALVDAKTDKISRILGKKPDRNYQKTDVRTIMIPMQHNGSDFRLSSIKEDMDLGYQTFMGFYQENADLFNEIEQKGVDC